MPDRRCRIGDAGSERASGTSLSEPDSEALYSRTMCDSMGHMIARVHIDTASHFATAAAAATYQGTAPRPLHFRTNQNATNNQRIDLHQLTIAQEDLPDSAHIQHASRVCAACSLVTAKPRR